MRYTVSQIVGLTTVVLFVALAVPAHGLEKVKVAIPAPGTAFAALYHAQSAGHFAEEGLDVEVVVLFGNGSLQAVLSREAQFAAAPGTYHLMVHEKGQRLVSVMSLVTRNAINVVMHREVAKAKGITTASPLADKIRALKGLRLSGVTPGGFAHQVLIYYVLKAGLDPQKDVQIVGLGNSQALVVALEQRQIDGFSTGTPIPESAVARGFGLMVVDNSAGEDPDFAEFMMDVLMVSPDTVRNNPSLVRKMVRAILKSSAWLLDHPAEQAISAIKPILSRLDEAVILSGLQKTRLGIPRDGKITERAVTLTQDFLHKVGALKTTIPYDQLVMNDFLPR